MKSKYGFNQFTISEFEAWIKQLSIARTIRTVQEHHTYIPNYNSFKGNNHFKLQKSMKNHHVNSNGWSDIGQHFTSYPDGKIVSGRSLEKTPACIYGFNSNSICIEHIGNFDLGKDQMTEEHKAAIIRMTASICHKFNIEVNTDKIVYHHWFNLSTGKRNNGTGKNKSCPGTNFFNGNKVNDCEANFIPLVKEQLKGTSENTPNSTLVKYVSVTASKLNIRAGAERKNKRVKDREAASLGAILRVYEEKNGWYKISSSKSHWVFGKYAKDVFVSRVTASRLNARLGPGTKYERIDSYKKGTELWIDKIENGWCKVNFEDKWVSKRYLKLD